MYFKQFLNDDAGCSSYFIASRQTRDAVVIDPQLDIQQYLDLARERDYRITLVIDTHLHADHISGNRRLAGATGAQICMYQGADVLFPFRGMYDGEEVMLGQLILRVVHTPGHRPESLSLIVVNPERSPEPSLLLSGDTLFVGDVGRPDFGGPAGALEEWASIQKLLELEDYVEVFPAHFEGSCGKGMCGRPSSTIGFERRFNPVLQLSKDDFLRATGEVPARPLNMTAIIATNRGEADYSWAMPRELRVVPTIDVAAAPGWIADHHPLVLDVREPAEYEAGHVPGAVPLPQFDLALRLQEVPRDREVLVVCAAGSRSLRVSSFLEEQGYRNVTNLAGGTMGWMKAGNAVEQGATTTVR